MWIPISPHTSSPAATVSVSGAEDAEARIDSGPTSVLLMVAMGAVVLRPVGAMVLCLQPPEVAVAAETSGNLAMSTLNERLWPW